MNGIENNVFYQEHESPIEFNMNNSMLYHPVQSQPVPQPTPHLAQTSLPHTIPHAHYNNSSPSFTVNSLKTRNRQQLNKLINDTSRLHQYMDSNEMLVPPPPPPPEPKSDCDWDKLEEAAQVIANVQHAFEMSDNEINEYNDDEQLGYHHINHTRGFHHQRSHVMQQRNPFPAIPNTNPSNQKPSIAQKILPHTDAQTIAILLQKQLEDIDNEIRLIKEEKQNTEMRAEELESRVNNLELNGDEVNTNFKSNSPVNSGRSTPSQTKSDLFKVSLAKSKDNYKSLTVIKILNITLLFVFLTLNSIWVPFRFKPSNKPTEARI